jgi:solute carrier family 35, member F5
MGDKSCVGSDDDSCDSDSSLASTAEDKHSKQKKRATFRNTIFISLTFCMLWFSANYFYNSGLKYTLMSSSTVLSNTSMLFVFIFSFFFLRTEKMTMLKLIGVLISFGGATIITVSETKGGGEKAKHRLLGDGLTLLSAVWYGVYATFLKLKEKKIYSMSVFLGLVGAINIFVLLPLFPIFHYTGIESFRWPNARSFMFLSINAFISWFSDYWWANSVVLLGPLFTQLGISLWIPLGMLATGIFNKVNFGWMYYLGTIMVFFSFIGVTWLQYREMKEKELERLKKKKENKMCKQLEKKNINLKQLEANGY